MTRTGYFDDAAVEKPLLDEISLTLTSVLKLAQDFLFGLW
jgi:hypothetical protein